MKGGRIHYTDDQMAWLDSNRTMIISDYHSAFCTAFPGVAVSAANLHGLRKRKGWKVGRGAGRLAGRRRAYSDAEIAWLTENRTLELSEYHQRFTAEFHRPDVTPEKLHSLRKREKLRTGRTGRFEKGGVSHNKGKTCPPGVGGRHPNAQRTQFKKGQLPHNTKFEGHERLHDNGYVLVSVKETNPHTGFERRYVLKHVHQWEKAFGPVPEDHCLKCLSDDKANADPSNWELIPRGVLPRLSGGRNKSRPAFDQAEPELRPALMTLAKIEHRASQLRKQHTA